MKRLISAKPLFAAVLALGTLGAVSAAHARSDVFFSIGVQAPYGYAQQSPVYVQPAPIYVEPQPIYVQPQPQPFYGQPQPYYGQPQVVYYGSHRGHERRGGPWGDADRDGVPNFRDRDSRFYDGRGAHRAGAWGDADRDGVPNRYDRAPNNPYRR